MPKFPDDQVKRCMSKTNSRRHSIRPHHTTHVSTPSPLTKAGSVSAMRHAKSSMSQTTTVPAAHWVALRRN
jgi:hypothetical protein